MGECDRCGGQVIFGICQTCMQAPGEDGDDYLSYLPEGRVQDMLRYPDNRHLY